MSTDSKKISPEYLTVLDIKFPKHLVNMSAVAREAGFSVVHTYELCRGTRKSIAAKKKVKSALVKLYSDILKPAA